MSIALRALVQTTPTRWPPLSCFGPFRLVEALPWLLLASSLRVVAWSQPNIVGLLVLVLADTFLFLAFILVARRMIEMAEGRTDLGRRSFAEQIDLARAVIGSVLVLLAVVAMLLVAAGLRELAPRSLLAFDGIAFDQPGGVAKIWSSVLACLVLLMVVRADRDGAPRLFASVGELTLRLRWLGPAILVVVALQFGLSFVQGWARVGVRAYYFNPFAPEIAKRALFFAFVVGFAAIRLWLTLAVLTFALRASYRERSV